MKITELKVYASLVLMILLLAMAFITNDVINSKLYTALSLIIGLNTSRTISTQKLNSNEQHRETETN
jgi:hypothetical protein